MNKNNNGKFFTSLSLGTAAVWFSTHCGAGFASGTQELQYFSNHGWFGPLMPVFAIILIGLIYYVGLETARQTDTWNYDGWSKLAFDPWGKFCSLAMDFSIILTTIAASAASIASGAELISQTFNIPVFIGSIIMFAIITLICVFGEKVVRKNAMIMTIAILIIITVVIVLGLTKFWPNIVDLYSNRYVNPDATKWSVTGTEETVPGSFFNAMLWALTYVGFQFGAIGGISAAFRGAQSKKESKGAIISGIVMNALMLSGICLLIFSNMPGIYTDPSARKLPTVYIVNHLDAPILQVVYPLLLFLALITTAVGFTFGMVQRLDPYVFKNMKNQFARRSLISIICLGVCYAVSTLGLMWVVQVAYKYLGIFNWIFLIIPLLVLGHKNIRKRDQAGKVQ